MKTFTIEEEDLNKLVLSYCEFMKAVNYDKGNNKALMLWADRLIQAHEKVGANLVDVEKLKMLINICKSLDMIDEDKKDSCS